LSRFSPSPLPLSHCERGKGVVVIKGIPKTETANGLFPFSPWEKRKMGLREKSLIRSKYVY
jgi:hypothetical protein